MKNTQEAQIGTLVKQTRDENLTFLYFNYFFNARSYSYCSLSPILISRQSVIMRLNRFYSLKRHEKHPWDVSIKLKLALLWMIYWCILFQRKRKKLFIIFNQNVIVYLLHLWNNPPFWLSSRIPFAWILPLPFTWLQSCNNHFSQYNLFQIDIILL